MPKQVRHDIIKNIWQDSATFGKIFKNSQEEIYFTIKDHHLVSFDQIKRRFLKVPERTLRYDLKKLVEKDLIMKVGKTRGSYYRAKIN